jgi:hypothetical protein
MNRLRWWADALFGQPLYGIFLQADGGLRPGPARSLAPRARMFRRLDSTEQIADDTAAVGPFDPTLARFATCRVPLDRVVDPLAAAGHAPERVAEYADRMREGDRFPPVSVIRVGRRLLVADGHKRLRAAASLGAEDVLVEVWPLRRWVGDQLQQAVANSRKNATILFCVVSDPVRAARLARSTLLHWRRVVVSLVALARMR